MTPTDRSPAPTPQPPRAAGAGEPTISPRYDPEHPDIVVLDIDTSRRGALFILDGSRHEIHVPVDELELLTTRLRTLAAIANTNRLRTRLFPADEETSS